MSLTPAQERWQIQKHAIGLSAIGDVIECGAVSPS
jgi:hypothetical protein